MNSTPRRQGAKTWKPKPSPNFGTQQTALEYELTSVLIGHCGERGGNAGAVETRERILPERAAAFLAPALDRLASLRLGVFAPLR